MSRLIIELDEENRWVTFRKAEPPAGGDAGCGLQLRNAFTLDDVVAAACATGWVVQSSGDCYIDDRVDRDALAQCLNEMFSYFIASGEPREELLRVKHHVDDYWQEVSQHEPIASLWTYAWLDLTVRDDVAEEARGMENTWTVPQRQIELATHCRQRVKELVQRYARLSEACKEIVSQGRMAPSQRVRRGRLRDSEAG